MRLRRGLSLPIVLGTILGAGCTFQTYRAAPVDRETLVAAYEARDPDAPAIRDFRRERGAEPEAWPLVRWGFGDLAWLAWEGHPDLVAAQSQARVGEAGIAVASRRLNPSLRFTPEHHRDRDPGDRPWGLALDLDVPVVTANKRGIAREQAELAAQIARIDAAQVAWQVRSRLRARYVEWVDAQRDRESTAEEVRLREEVVALMDRRVELGHAASVDAAPDRLRLGEARIAAAQAEARAVQARSLLAEACGIPHERFEALRLVPDWPGSQAVQGEKIAWSMLRPDELRRRVAFNRLDIERALVGYAAGEAALKLEVARQYPDLTLRPGYHFEPTDTVWSVGLAMLAPILDRNEAGIAQAEARRLALADEVRAVQARAFGEAQVAAARLRQAQDEVARAARQREATEAGVARIERRFERGAADRRERTLARLDLLLAARREQLAMAGRERALGQLEDAMQRPIDS